MNIVLCNVKIEEWIQWIQFLLLKLQYSQISKFKILWTWIFKVYTCVFTFLSLDHYIIMFSFSESLNLSLIASRWLGRTRAPGRLDISRSWPPSSRNTLNASSLGLTMSDPSRCRWRLKLNYIIRYIPRERVLDPPPRVPSPSYQVCTWILQKVS